MHSNVQNGQAVLWWANIEILYVTGFTERCYRAALNAVLSVHCALVPVISSVHITAHCSAGLLSSHIVVDALFSFCLWCRHTETIIMS